MDPLKVTRIGEWLPDFSVILLGALLSYAAAPGPLIAIFAAFLFATSSYFIINDYFDAPYDRFKKNNTNPIAKGKLSKGAALGLAAASLAIAFSIVYFLLPSFILHLFLASMTISFLYSAKPFRFKERFLIDVATHGAMGSVVILIGYLLFAPADSMIALFSLLMFIFSVVQALYGEIRDFAYDKKAGFRNTVCTLGIRNSILLVIVLYAASILLFALITYLYFPLYVFATLVPVAVYLNFLVKTYRSPRINGAAFIARDKKIRFLLVIGFSIVFLHLLWINLAG
ncbi:MAG: UbiA prenyltransferase family protein [Candidatus Aenigmarchaeota archaeon]|nr:UbiA prenyltransferase family protein [Candidatus Aenigmarchaeota archaeon]